MTEHFFYRDRLDVYRLSIEYVATAFDTSRSLEEPNRRARDQWLRANTFVQSITSTSTAMLSTSTAMLSTSTARSQDKAMQTKASIELF